jgi:hypothetical protein
MPQLNTPLSPGIWRALLSREVPRRASEHTAFHQFAEVVIELGWR